MICFALGRRRRNSGLDSSGQPQIEPSSISGWPLQPTEHDFQYNRRGNTDTVRTTWQAASLGRGGQYRLHGRSTQMDTSNGASTESVVDRVSRNSYPSEMSETGYTGPRQGAHDTGEPENMGHVVGPASRHYEMPGMAYYEMPTSTGCGLHAFLLWV